MGECAAAAAWISVKIPPASAPGCAEDFAYLPHAGRMSPRIGCDGSALGACREHRDLVVDIERSSDARHSTGMYRMSVEYLSQYGLRRTPFAATRGWDQAARLPITGGEFGGN